MTMTILDGHSKHTREQWLRLARNSMMSLDYWDWVRLQVRRQPGPPQPPGQLPADDAIQGLDRLEEGIRLLKKAVLQARGGKE